MKTMPCIRITNPSIMVRDYKSRTGVMNQKIKKKVQVDIIGNLVQNGPITNFENCNFAVVLNRMTARIMKNKSIQTNAGFLLNQADAKNFIVGQNNLNGVMLGIFKSGNESSINGGFAGFNNNITLAQYPFIWGMISGQSLGIQSIYFSPNNSGTTQLSHNVINSPLPDYSSGIMLFRGMNDYIQHNTINFNFAGTAPSVSTLGNSNGIALSANKNTRVYNNHVLGNNTTTPNYADFINNRRITGIRMTNNNENSYVVCNTASNLQFGMHVQGDNLGLVTSYDRIKGNTLSAQTVDMLFLPLAGEGTLGDIGTYNQLPYYAYDANNQFLGNTTLNRVYRFTTCMNPTSDKIVTQSTNLNASALVYPSSTNLGISCRYDVQNPPSFNQIFTCPNNLLFMTPEGEEVDVQTALDIAQDSITYSQFQDGAHELDKDLLLQWLARDTSILVASPILDSFYHAQYNDVILELNNIDQLIGKLTDSVLVDNSSAWDATWTDAYNRNEAILSGEVFETNERFINQLYLLYLAYGLDTLDSIQVDLVRILAESCPYLAGEAVYKARTLYSMFVPNVQYDDLVICNSQGVYKNGTSLLDQINQQMNNHYEGLQTMLNVNEIQLYPNPANSLVNVKYKIEENHHATLKLYNIIGNEVRHIDLSWKNNHVSFSVNDLMSGVYIYKYNIDGKLNSTGKLVIE